MEVIFSATDPIGYTVIAEKETWFRHVVGGDHSIMEGNECAAQLTIEDPDCVYRSSTNCNRQIYFRQNAGASYSSTLYTKVVADFTTTPAKLVSAWPQESVKGSIGELLYERD